MKSETQDTKKLTTKERMYADILQHGNNLNAIFNTGIEPVKLCKKLHTLEVKAHKLATDYCNGENGVTTDNFGQESSPILTAVKKILFKDTFNADSDLYKAIFLNGDARGYALKIKDEFMRTNNIRLYSDMGGYGILAPEFDGKN